METYTKKKTTLGQRIKAAVRAFQGKNAQIQSITYGVRLTDCDKCERGECETCCYKHQFEEHMALPNCNDCGHRWRNRCPYLPRLGETVRINCPLWAPKEEAKQ